MNSFPRSTRGSVDVIVPEKWELPRLGGGRSDLENRIIKSQRGLILTRIKPEKIRQIPEAPRLF